MTAKGKDTIYVDVDEEITSIVGKITSSKTNIIALVLPKRANVLQSIVNMKLLKRTADQNDKQVVLITSEARLLPLAGAAGLFVASNLTSKPYLPPAPKIDGETIGQDVPAEDIEISPDTPVSTLAPEAKYADDEEAIEIDNTPKETAGAAAAATAGKAGKKGGSKLKVPNFSKFRKRIIFGALALLLLIFGLVYGLLVAPNATITLKAETTDVPVNFTFVADVKTTDFNKENKIVRAVNKETEKTDSEKVPATGELDKGNKASGTASLKNCSKSDGKVTVPAGTGLSSGEFTFVTASDVTLDQSVFSGGGTCLSSTKDVSVIAQKSGDKYNLSPRKYTVAGHSGVEASGSAMTGGTSQIVKVVSNADIEKAKERLNSKQNTIQDEMKNQMSQEGFIAISDTFQASPANYSPSPAVNSEAAEVTVTVKTKYTMLGAKEDDLKELIAEEVKKAQEGKSQEVLSHGLDDAIFKKSSVSSKLSDGQTALSIDAKAVTGPDLDQEQLKEELKGKKKGEAEEILKQRQGISDPKVELKPFWVTKIPKASKVTIDIQKADGSEIN